MLDITLLRVIKYKREFNKLRYAIKNTGLDEVTQTLVEAFEKYYTKFPDHEKIDFTVFVPSFKRWYPRIKDELFATYVATVGNIQKDVDDDVRDNLLEELLEINLGNTLANVLREYDEGELEFPLKDVLEAKIDEFKVNTGSLNKSEWIDDDIGDLLETEEDGSGVTWRLTCLKNSMRRMRGGDFGLVAGRPDKGKTTFLASESTYFANQLPEDRNILWFNNEGSGKRIVPRLYQAALGLSLTEILKLNHENKLIEKYEEVVGRKDKIRVIDCHGWHVGQVENVIEKMNAGIVIIDMIDHVKGFSGEPRTDLQLEEMYKWARERAVKHECIMLGTSQISAEGDGLMYPTLSMLKDSKTGKQGAVDFQVMIGASNDQGLAASRFISLPKNKLHREGFPKDPRQEVRFDPVRARYEDIKEGS